jgi:hypothetical protein
MSWIAKHRQKAKKLADVFSDTRLSAIQLARESNNEMDWQSKSNAYEWVNAMQTLDGLSEPVEYNDDGTVKLPDFPV